MLSNCSALKIMFVQRTECAGKEVKPHYMLTNLHSNLLAQIYVQECALH